MNKHKLIERMIREGKITIDEAMVLLDREQVSVHYQYPFPIETKGECDNQPVYDKSFTPPY